MSEYKYQTNWERAVARKRAEWGDKLDLSHINEAFTPFYGRKDIRLEVVTPWDDEPVLHGWVGVTTGWRPALLLMRRVDSDGSSDVIGADWRITGWKWRGDRRYKAPITFPDYYSYLAQQAAEANR
jgi:hypothetical protein